MHMEWARLRTFSYFPFTMDVSAIRLARAGFFLSGSNCVTCYSCEVMRSTWDDNEDPDIFHQRVSPACSSVTGLENTNIPIYRLPEVTAPEVKEAPEGSRDRNASSDGPQETTKGNDVSRTNGKQSLGDRNQSSDSGDIPRRADQVASRTDDVLRETNHTASRTGDVVRETNHTASRTDDVVRESNHTASRTDDVVRETNHTASRTDDVVRETNHTASRTDDVVRETNHTASRTDDVVRETNHTASRTNGLNEATNGLEMGKQKHKPSEFRPEYKNDVSDKKALATADTGNLSRPKYPAYAVLRVREASYDTWPKHLSQTKEEMAEAGFVFSGHADYTRCFFCGGGLRNWMPGDDAWIEHARWFPRCTYLLQSKGADYVRSIQGSYPASADKCGSDARAVTDEPKSRVPTDMWTYAAVQSLLDMGYDRAIIERATCNVVNNRSIQDVEAVELLDEVFRIQDAVDSDYVSDPTSFPNDRQPVTRDTSYHSEDAETRLLMQENQEMRDMSMCKVCSDTEVAIVFLPCGHFVCCSECAPAMMKCPACKVIIQASVRAWLV
ncbi:baculoviral IAP repeat-containing protein 3-like isoform X2 [Pecten maximus]|uniref:baculoviral IAP repeat-containing protein 3-like isoform X2 n=1 Tax=Pecten maximus TaxID=6579 RepID=UPI001458221A|nr:baculoviral IAP repeat-containing protein 3-like isoform X2 [Pecten maximus]